MSDVTARPVVIKCRENGPLLVTGPAQVVNSHGQVLDLTGQETFALCRCGLSRRQPFCDSSHKAAEWKSADAPASGGTA